MAMSNLTINWQQIRNNWHARYPCMGLGRIADSWCPVLCPQFCDCFESSSLLCHECDCSDLQGRKRSVCSLRGCFKMRGNKFHRNHCSEEPQGHRCHETGCFMKLCESITNERLCQTVYPAVENVFNWTRFCRPDDVKVVILGQDPYPGVGMATGLAFGVLGQQSIPLSLINIGIALENDGFLKPSHGGLIGWAQQGVLLLNTALTLRDGDPGSHTGKGWEKLTDAVIEYISKKGIGVVFMLWGREAEKKKSLIDMCKHLVLGSYHPTSWSPERECFQRCHHFSLANKYLELDGKKVYWNRTEPEK